MKRLRSFGVALVGSVLVLALAPAALASPVEEVYGGFAGDVQDGVASGVLGQGDTLPFTGLNLVLIVLAGLSLIATGLLLRRRRGGESA